MSTLEHDPVRHIYHLNGVRIPSNTDILEWAGFSNYDEANQFNGGAVAQAAAVGDAVAKATELMDRRKPWKEYSHVAGYVEAWKKFKKDFRFKPTIIEEPLCDPDYGVATKPDRGGDSRLGIITVQQKTYRPNVATAIQTAFEEWCIYRKLGIEIKRSTKNRFGVELRHDGTYSAHRFTDPNDIQVFFSAVTCYKWHQKNNTRRMRLWQPNQR